jgi:acyl-CoA reductase-like NAD-dependent aldehyde dehydrogenase
MASPTNPLNSTEFYNTIDGKFMTTAKTRHSINPATGKPNPEVPLSTQDDVDKATVAAKRLASSGLPRPTLSVRVLCSPMPTL